MTDKREEPLRQEAVVRYLIEMGPGRTALELSRAIYGQEILYGRVGSVCRSLQARGLVRRKGSGKRNDPYRYWPAE